MKVKDELTQYLDNCRKINKEENNVFIIKAEFENCQKNYVKIKKKIKQMINLLKQTIKVDQ